MFSWIAENPVSSVLFLVSLFCLAQAWLLKKDFFSPVNVYCFSQSITLAVAYLKLDYAMTDFKPTMPTTAADRKATPDDILYDASGEPYRVVKKLGLKDEQ